MKLFKDLSISKKITVLITSLIFLLMLTAAFGIYKMNVIGQELKIIQTDNLPLIELVAHITEKQLEKAVLIERAMRVAGVTSSEQTVPELHRRVTELTRIIDDEIQDAEDILMAAKGRALGQKLKGEIEAIERAMLSVEQDIHSLEGVVERMMDRLEQGAEVSESDVVMLEQQQRSIEIHMEEILVSVEKMTEHTIEKVDHDEEIALKGMFWLSAFSIMIGALLGVLITRGITRPLARAVEASQRLASGDLTVKLEANSADETGQLLNAMHAMSERLLDMVSHIAAATEQLSGATNEVAAVTTQTARSIESQTEQLDQASVALNQMLSTVKLVSEHASEAATSTASADQQAKNGREIVSQVNISIQELASQIEHAQASITRLDAETNNVDRILAVITAIAEQTNLLALNAAIEAARAGTAGRGFAVVADEVRSLASKTQQSIITIQEMVGTLKSEARMCVDAMNEGYSKAGVTVKHAQQAESVLLEITGATDTISAMNVQIASTAEQQSAVTEQVSASVIQIHGAGAEISTGAQQVSVAAEELAQLSENLKRLVGQFKVS
ncbi:methyl-accepting chemotaxis protein [Nitrincola sp. MINF-07-Sa-05]|uniref:methyl-accepting chemotaxis protein n=1 Tax=Nitrincola salilacus TaxID=3400273 RepID=UPI00391807E4